MMRINTFSEYQKEYQLALENPEDFWAKQASQFVWRKLWNTVLQGGFEQAHVRWFE